MGKNIITENFFTLIKIIFSDIIVAFNCCFIPSHSSKDDLAVFTSHPPSDNPDKGTSEPFSDETVVLGFKFYQI